MKMKCPARAPAGLQSWAEGKAGLSVETTLWSWLPPSCCFWEDSASWSSGAVPGLTSLILQREKLWKRVLEFWGCLEAP